MAKVVTKKKYDEFESKLNEQREKMENKVFRTSKSGELVRKALFRENETKWASEWAYILANVSELYGECFTFDINEDGEETSKLDSELKDELVKEIFELPEDSKISYKTNTLFWGMMAEAQYIKMEKEFKEMTVEEENSSTPSSTDLEEYLDENECSEEDIKDLKSNKGK